MLAHIRLIYQKLTDYSLQLLLFGGHGTGGWLSRYDVYYNDCIVLDRGECVSENLRNFLDDNVCPLTCILTLIDVNDPLIDKRCGSCSYHLVISA